MQFVSTQGHAVWRSCHHVLCLNFFQLMTTLRSCLLAIKNSVSSFPPRKCMKRRWMPHQSATDTCLNTKTWKDERDILKPRNLRYQKWPYYKGIHLFQTIILGIHPLVFGDVSALNAITCLPRHTVQELRDVRNTWHENNDFWWCTCSPGLSPWICE